MNKEKLYKILLIILVTLIILAVLIFWAFPYYNNIQFNKGVKSLILQQTQQAVCFVTNGTNIIQLPIQ